MICLFDFIKHIYIYILNNSIYLINVIIITQYVPTNKNILFQNLLL